jgi:hypothetical protein
VQVSQLAEQSKHNNTPWHHRAPYFGLSGEVVDQALIHAGFQDAYHAIRPAVMTRLTAMAEEYPEFEIIITLS